MSHLGVYMLKLVLISLIFLCSISIGVLIKKHLYIKHQIYLDFNDIIKSIKSEIYFLKTDKEQLLKKQSCINKESEEILQEYIRYNKVTSKYLDDSENNKIYEMLENIGKNNVEGEIKSLEYYENILSKNCQLAGEKYNKYGIFAVKLSIIAGTLISILLI